MQMQHDASLLPTFLVSIPTISRDFAASKRQLREVNLWISPSVVGISLMRSRGGKSTVKAIRSWGERQTWA